MAQYDISEQEPKRRSGAGLIVLLILLLIAGIIGYLAYSVLKAPLALDDPEKLAASAPMTPEERFVFSADGTVQVKLDKGDLWSLILAHTGPDFLDLVNDAIGDYGFSVSGCAIRIAEEGMRLDVEAFYQETRLVVKVPCTLEISGQHISLKPAGVKLGLIPLPVEGLLSSVELEYDLPLPVIAQVNGVSFERDAIVLTGRMEQDLRELMPEKKKLHRVRIFSAQWRTLSEALLTEEGQAALLEDLENDPGAVEELYRGLFVLADADAAEAYLEDRFGMTRRFLPNIDFTAAAEEQAALETRLTEQSNDLEQFFTKAVNDYNEKHFTLSNGEFVKNRVAFQAAEYGGETFAPLFEILDPESFFLILVDVEDGYIRKTSSFYRMADENQQFTQSVDFNKTYILGCVFRSVTGEPYLMYESEIQNGNTYSRVIVLRPLTEEAAAQLQVPGVFGVYTG